MHVGRRWEQTEQRKVLEYRENEYRKVSLSPSNLIPLACWSPLEPNIGLCTTIFKQL